MEVYGTEFFHEGQARRIEFAVLRGGSVPAKEFLNGPWPDRQRAHAAAIRGAIHVLAATGLIKNPTRYKKLEGTNDLFVFKAHQLRLYHTTLPGRLVILLDGLVKKDDKLAKSDLRRLEELRDAVMAWHAHRGASEQRGKQ